MLDKTKPLAAQAAADRTAGLLWPWAAFLATLACFAYHFAGVAANAMAGRRPAL